MDYINAENRTQAKLVRKTKLEINGSDIIQEVNIERSGVYTSGLRDKYASLSQDDRLKEIEKTISSSYKNSVSVKSISFEGLDKIEDIIKYSCNYMVKDEISEVGDLRILKLPFEDMVASVDNFSNNKRLFPVEYYRYEEADEYETIIDVTAPVGTKFIELPKDEVFTFMGSSYSLKYIRKDNNHVSIIRKASLKRNDVAVDNYSVMKDFLNNIVKAESKYLAYKEN